MLIDVGIEGQYALIDAPDRPALSCVVLFVKKPLDFTFVCPTGKILHILLQ